MNEYKIEVLLAQGKDNKINITVKASTENPDRNYPPPIKFIIAAMSLRNRIVEIAKDNKSLITEMELMNVNHSACLDESL